MYAHRGPSKCCDPEVQYQVFPVFLLHPNPIMAFPVVPAEQLVGAPEFDPDAVNILRKNHVVTLRDFSNVELELPQVRAMLGEMFGIKSDSDMGLKLQLSRAIGVW